MIKIKIEKKQIVETLNLLSESPDKERVVLWLGKKFVDFEVHEIYLPLQETAEDYFYIPPEGMNEIMAKLKENGQMLVAQIHTHPEKAFHSKADDNWAILRHLNAYSLVIPYFCATTCLQNFKRNAKTFVLTSSNKWGKTSNKNIVII